MSCLALWLCHPGWLCHMGATSCARGQSSHLTGRLFVFLHTRCLLTYSRRFTCNRSCLPTLLFRIRYLPVCTCRFWCGWPRLLARFCFPRCRLVHSRRFVCLLVLRCQRVRFFFLRFDQFTCLLISKFALLYRVFGSLYRSPRARASAISYCIWCACRA